MSREAIIEARMVLLMRAMRSEFSQAAFGEFERQWNEIDPASPAPQRQEVRNQRDRLLEILIDRQRALGSPEYEFMSGRMLDDGDVRDLLALWEARLAREKAETLPTPLTGDTV